MLLIIITVKVLIQNLGIFDAYLNAGTSEMKNTYALLTISMMLQECIKNYR